MAASESDIIKRLQQVIMVMTDGQSQQTALLRRMTERATSQEELKQLRVIAESLIEIHEDVKFKVERILKVGDLG